MKRFLIEVAYDGTNYCGWQIQPNGITIEEKLNEVLSAFLEEEIRVMGASRTDAGVHAMGNMAVFDSETTIPPDRLCYALNTKLPEDIRIRSSKEVAGDFHPRYTKSLKTYEYHILNARLPIPTDRLYTRLVTAPLDVGAMREGAALLVGEHDFKSFCAAGSSAKTTVRTVRSIEIEEVICDTSFLTDGSGGEEASGPVGSDGKDVTGLAYSGGEKARGTVCSDGEKVSGTAGSGGEKASGTVGYDRKIIIRVTGEGFLYNMVRIISGTLINVGLHVYPPDHVKEILEARDRTLAASTAPAKGLFLKKIRFL